MKFRVPLILLLSAILFGSCQKEFDPTGEWEESYAAYCLLNLKDSVQYVRINRIFLSRDNPANHFQEPDSVNVDPGLMEVSLQALKEGIAEGEPTLFIPTDELIKDDGQFSSGSYYVFKSPVALQGDHQYRLSIRNRETGFEMQAETSLLGSRPLAYSFVEPRVYNINMYHPESMDYDGDLTTSQYEKRVIRLLYYEIRDGIKWEKYLDWRSPYAKSAAGNFADTAQLSDELLQYFADNIPVDPEVDRIAVGVDKMLIINDDLVNLYIGYTNYQSTGQFTPDMSNFDQGTGVLASRYYYTFFAMKLRPQTLDTLAYGRFTRQLRFADSQGNWPPD